MMLFANDDEKWHIESGMVSSACMIQLLLWCFHLTHQITAWVWLLELLRTDVISQITQHENASLDSFFVFRRTRTSKTQPSLWCRRVKGRTLKCHSLIVSFFFPSINDVLTCDVQLGIWSAYISILSCSESLWISRLLYTWSDSLSGRQREEKSFPPSY